MLEQQHYQISSPLDTHWRVASCAESGCGRHAEGFTVTADEETELGQRQAAHIRGDKTRRHRERRDETELTVFEFEPGQECFSTVVHKGQVRHGHLVPIDRPELYLVHGDGFRYEHSGPNAWVDDLNTNQDRLARLING